MIIVIFVTIVKYKIKQYTNTSILKEVRKLIDYSPFWNTLNESDETTYTLINKYRVSSATIDKLRNNKPITTTTLNDLCRIFNCDVQNIIRYIPSESDQQL